MMVPVVSISMYLMERWLLAAWVCRRGPHGERWAAAGAVDRQEAGPVSWACQTGQAADSLGTVSTPSAGRRRVCAPYLRLWEWEVLQPTRPPVHAIILFVMNLYVLFH